MVEDTHAAVDDPELLVDVEVGDDARDDPGDVQDVQDRDGHQAGGQEGAEVPGLPVLDHDGEEDDVEQEGEQGNPGPGYPPPCRPGDNLTSGVSEKNILGKTKK